jgi:hypothetical protein
LSLPLPHFGQVLPAERPDPDWLIVEPPIVPTQFPLKQKAHPQTSHLVFIGGDEYFLPHPGQVGILISLPKYFVYKLTLTIIIIRQKKIKVWLA